ncbi:hypothetical protein [Kitasatospora sp. NPDC096140]|uniref:hypothetical protein n=1 Tax=unclassified Kitasatospora TaxID=2633591 RepID=UPI00331722AA
MSGDSKDQRDLSPHSFTPRPGSEPSGDNLTVLVGYVGTGPTDDLIRLYVDVTLASYYEFAADDVVRTASVDPDNADSPRRLWIRDAAQVRLVRVNQVTGPAAFLQGRLRSRFASRLVSRAIHQKEPESDPFWTCPTEISVTEATTGTWPCSGTDVWPQCPDCC